MFVEYVADEVLTYEEVAILNPDPQRKRPVVLIGPDKVGRKELRQRLILISQDRFAGVVPREYRTLVQLRVKSVNDTSNQYVS